MVSQEAPSTKSDRDEQKAALVAFLGACPHVYGLDDRMTMWEKIGNAAVAALETCNADLGCWANDVLDGIAAKSGRVASCKEIADAYATFESKPDHWKVECLRTMKELRLVLPILARDAWKSREGANNGNV